MENNTFGSRLKALRQERKLTQEKFADIFYLNKSSISKYEKDKNLPENHLLIKIADFFDVSIDYLLCRSAQRKLLPCIPDSEEIERILQTYTFSEDEIKALSAYLSFPEELKKEVLDYIRFKQQ